MIFASSLELNVQPRVLQLDCSTRSVGSNRTWCWLGNVFEFSIYIVLCKYQIYIGKKSVALNLRIFINYNSYRSHIGCTSWKFDIRTTQFKQTSETDCARMARFHCIYLAKIGYT